MTDFIKVFIGAGLGGIFRYSFYFIPIKYHTVFINIISSFLIGIIYSFLIKKNLLQYKSFLLTGFLGGFSTFSSFSFEFINLLEKNITEAFFYLFFSIILSFIFTFSSLKLGLKYF